MPAPPPNPYIRTAQPGRRLVVLLGGPDGSEPTLADQVDYLRVIEVGRMAGGQQLDYCRLVYDLTKTGEQLVDLQTPEGWNRKIEVRLADDFGEPTAAVLFWGEIPQQRITINKDGEGVELTASLQPYHFGVASAGGILEGMKYWDPVSEAVITVRHRDIIFNPLLDGQPFGNRSGFRHPDYDYQLWVDPEAIRTETANTKNNNALGQSERLWELWQIVETLCKATNPDEDAINNPDDFDLDVIDDTVRVTGLTLPRGKTLPEYLDAVLTPYGYGWYVAPSLAEGGASSRKITIFKRSTGPQKQVYLQRPGATLDLAASNVVDLSWELDVSQLANQIVADAALKEFEITITLYECWSVADDELTAGDLLRSDPESQYHTAFKQDVRRLFAANEGGDYCSLRDAIGDEPRDLSAAFDPTDDVAPRRRPLGDTLLLDAEGNRVRPVLEWTNDDNVDEEEANIWIPAPQDWQYTLLRDQIGIRFTGDAPPPEVFTDGFELRLTGTIQSDQPLKTISESTSNSPNANVVAIHLDLSDKFSYRKRKTTGDFATKLDPGEDAEYDEVDEFALLEAYVDQLRDIEQSAAARASLTLFGLCFDYQIGDLLTAVAGRGISFNRNAPSVEQKRYVQIVGIRWKPEQQQTELIVAPAEDVVDLGRVYA